MSTLNGTVADITAQIIARSKAVRAKYLQQIAENRDQQPERRQLSCGNLAHGFAACDNEDKDRIRLMAASNIGIVTAYNDMLSAHQPYADYPEKIKGHVREMGCSAQVAGGVPVLPAEGLDEGQGRPRFGAEIWPARANSEFGLTSALL